MTADERIGRALAAVAADLCAQPDPFERLVARRRRSRRRRATIAAALCLILVAAILGVVR